MRRSLTIVMLALLGVLGIGISSNVANAIGFSETCNKWGGCAAANMSFSNRSATIQGYVINSPSGPTTVMFEFYAGGNIFSTQTRTADNEKRSFHFTEPGPVGGFDFVRVWLINKVSSGYIQIGDYPNR